MNFIVDVQLPKSLSDYLNFKGQDSIHTLDLFLGKAIFRKY
jgi:predicted nuclease of predicted toxin-antitoxin system